MITLVTGGARSGKSTFAESKYLSFEDVVYIATSRIWDDEMKERVAHHKRSRPSQWRTYEGNYNLRESIGDEKHYLLDCITVLTSNIMFDITKDHEYIDFELQRTVEDKVIEELTALINLVDSKGYDLIFVTNEVGLSIVPENHISRVFRDIQGRINQRIASLSHQVYLVCCGIPVKIK